MRFCSFVLPALALVASVFQSADAADSLALPWDGRGEDLTVATLTDKYLTHILTQRQSNSNADPADWVTIDQTGRSPGFNDDTGIINIAVDNASIFNGQTTFRRSELVQQLSAADTTFFRTSLMKSEAFINKHAWQVIFPESHVFTMTIDATLDTPMIYFYDSGYTSQWSTEFVAGTWYNFGIAITSSSMVLYESEGDADLAKVATVALTSTATDYEYHIGMLTLTTDGSEPTMASEQDILSFNGVSVESSITSTGAGSGSATTTTTTSSAASESAEASASSAASTSTTTTTASSAASEAAEASASSAASASTTTTETSESASAETTTASSSASEELEYSESASASAETTTAPATTTATPTATTATPTATTAAPTTTKESCNTRRTRRN